MIVTGTMSKFTFLSPPNFFWRTNHTDFPPFANGPVFRQQIVTLLTGYHILFVTYHNCFRNQICAGSLFSRGCQATTVLVCRAIAASLQLPCSNPATPQNHDPCAGEMVVVAVRKDRCAVRHRGPPQGVQRHAAPCQFVSKQLKEQQRILEETAGILTGPAPGHSAFDVNSRRGFV
jgi:hypothetical protein